jgi:hypothetical protein
MHAHAQSSDLVPVSNSSRCVGHVCGLPVDSFGFQGGNPHTMHACIADPLLSPKPGFATDMSVYTPPPPATCRSEPWCIARIPFFLVHSSVCYLRHFELSHIMYSLHFNSFAYWPKGYLALVMGIFSLWYRDSPPPLVGHLTMHRLHW